MNNPTNRLRIPGAQPAQNVPKEAIAKILTEVMDIAVSNGADSRSMPDEYVEVAAWLCGIPAQKVSSIPKKIGRVESGFKGMFLREAQAYKRGWNECRGAMLAAAPKPGAKP